MDTEYGADRNKYEDDGGYVIVVEKGADFQQIKDKAYIDCEDVISLINQIELTPHNLKNYMID